MKAISLLFPTDFSEGTLLGLKQTSKIFPTDVSYEFLHVIDVAQFYSTYEANFAMITSLEKEIRESAQRKFHRHYRHAYPRSQRATSFLFG